MNQMHAAQTTIDVTGALAAEIVELTRRGLDDRDVEQIRRLLLDHFAGAQRGAALPWTRELARWARRFSGTGAAPVLGTDYTATACMAALVHGTAAHGYELDDTHDATMSHPGCCVIPAVLAVGAELDASQAHVLLAIAAGYEAMGRVGMMSNALHMLEGGFHPTAVLGSFGAAAGAAALYGLHAGNLRPEVIVRAWGHALSQTGGPMQFSVEPDGGNIKRIHAGHAARNGVMAAEFAQLAIATPSHAIEGRYGLCRMFSFGDADPNALARNGDEPLQIHCISMKPYSCCRIFHSTIDAFGEVTDNFKLPADQIERIVVKGPQLIEDQHMMRRPQSVMAAQYSCPYMLGASLAYGPSFYTAYSAPYFNDPRILEIVDRVEFEYDQVLETYYPARFPTGVTMTLKDGTVRSSVVMDSFGTPVRPLSPEQIGEKAKALLSEISSGIDLARVKSMIWDDATGARALAEVVAGR